MIAYAQSRRSFVAPKKIHAASAAVGRSGLKDARPGQGEDKHLRLSKCLYIACVPRGSHGQSKLRGAMLRRAFGLNLREYALRRQFERWRGSPLSLARVRPGREAFIVEQSQNIGEHCLAAEILIW